MPRLLLAYLGLALAACALDALFELSYRFRPALEKTVFELRRLLAWSPLVVGAVVVYQQAPDRIEDGYHRSTLVRDDEGRSNLELYRWLRESSPRDAVYLTPPDLDGTRFLGQRAIVVDWKAVPLIPNELLTWYERLCDVTGRKLGSSADLGGYQSLDLERLRRIVPKYHPDYVVVRRGNERRLPGLPVTYQNGGFSVLQILPAALAPTPPQPAPPTEAAPAISVPEDQ